jgi:beta-glucanase (GH16 family)
MRFTFLTLIFLLTAPIAQAAPWKLVWSDEFDKPGAPDPQKWDYEVGYLRNHELQYYTRDRRENARVENGMLIIEARKDHYAIPADERKKRGKATARDVAEYTSASLTTRGKVDWTYGRIEVRAKLPTGRSMWPAIWTLGTDKAHLGWPKCGEIDIMENVGFDPDIIHGTVHTGKYNHMIHTAKGGQIKIAKPYDDFHVYAVEWRPERIDFFVDKSKYFTFHNDKTGDAAWPYDKPQYLILNIAIGGDWGGQKGIDEKIFPQRMYVDYVRVYKE